MSQHLTIMTPDLTIISQDLTYMSKDLPGLSSTNSHTGYLSHMLNSDIKITIKSLHKKRWNFRNADWPAFTKPTDQLSEKLTGPPSPNILTNYLRS